jgi:hypothetical protein
VLTFTGTVEHEPIPDRKSWEIVHRSQNDHDGRNESVRPRVLVAVRRMAGRSMSLALEFMMLNRHFCYIDTHTQRNLTKRVGTLQTPSFLLLG